MTISSAIGRPHSRVGSAARTSALPLPANLGTSLTPMQQNLLLRWIAALADQIKNPLAGVTAVVQVMERDYCDTAGATSSQSTVDRSAAFKMVRDRLRDLNLYVAELTGFAAPAQLRVRPVRLNELVAELVCELSERFDLATPICLDDRAGPQEVDCDPEKIRTILYALVKNSVEAIPPDQDIWLRVSTNQKVAEGRTWFELTLEDNGPGIPQNHLHLVNEPFFTTKEAGTGLGLTMTKKYMAGHGGHLLVEHSNALGGAQIRILFPWRNAT